MLLSHRTRYLLIAAAALFALAVAYVGRRTLRREARVEVPMAADFRLGYNLDFPGDWTNLPPFIDHFKNARNVRGTCADADPDCGATEHLDLDARGWVKTLAYRDDPSRRYDRVEIILNTSEDRYDIGERFVMTWQGSGELELWGAEELEQRPSAKRQTFVLSQGHLVLRLLSIDPQGTGDYLRNIRVFRQDQEANLAAGETFNPDMLAFLRPFSSLRFMDWMQSNEPGQCGGGERSGEECYAIINDDCPEGRCVMAGNWSERPLLEQAIWFSSGQFLDSTRPELGSKVGGYPLELMIDLANELHASPHFNVPAHFDTDYVRGLAGLIAQRLRADLPVSVEYSNEVWNWDFPQARYAEARGKKLWPERGTAWVEYMATRTHEMCRLLDEALAGDAERLRCLISPQTGWRDLAEDVLDCPAMSKGNPDVSSCIEHVDAINVTGYFAGCLPQHPQVIRKWLAQGEAYALDRAFEQLEHGGLIPECSGDDRDDLDFTIETYDHFMQLAARRGLGLEVYESGTHFEYEDDPRVKRFLVQVTKDERMKALYRRNVLGFRQVGGSVLNAWGWIAPDDAWANVDSPVDLDHPKYQALVELARELTEASSAPLVGAPQPQPGQGETDGDESKEP